MLSERTSTFGWYHSSSQLPCSAWPTSIAGDATASFGSSGATRSRRSLSLNGVGSSGSMSRPISSPIEAIAVTIGEAGGPNTRTRPRKSISLQRFELGIGGDAARRQAEHDEVGLVLDDHVGERRPRRRSRRR